MNIFSVHYEKSPSNELVVTKIKTQLQLSLLQKQLSLNAAQQTAILEQSPAGIVFTDFDFQLTKTNAQFLRQYGYKENEISSLSQVFCSSIMDRLSWEKQLREQLIDKGYVDCEISAPHRNGSLSWTHLRGTLISPLASPEIVWSLEDISHKKSLPENINFAASAYQASGAAMLIMDAQYKIVNVNLAFTEITGVNLIDIAGKPIGQVFDLPINQITNEDIIASVNEEGYWRGELLICRKNKNHFPAMVLINCIKQFDDCITHYVALFLDISDHKQLENELRYHAEIDPLTGLPNRKLLFQRLEAALASARRFNYYVALLYLDLDGFKQINDSLGHAQGDNVLIEIGQRLKCCVRDVDTAARLGGDEFVVVLNGTSKEMIAVTAQRIIDSLTLTVTENGIERQVSASIGIAIYPEDSTSPQTLLKYADEAMYMAKYKGKRQFCWHGNVST